MSNFIVNQNHPLIPREQTYVLDRKLISFHSVDRDIKQWSFANQFEITLPTPLENIQSMRLVNISLPSNQYVFSNEYQNTKFNFSVDVSGTINSHDVTIDPGSYTPTQLATEVQNKMNKAVQTYYTYNYDPSFADISDYNNFVCKYNKIANTFWFGNDGSWGLRTDHKQGWGQFSLNFHIKMPYTISCQQKEVWAHYTKWGFPAYLGYERKKYTATPTPHNLQFPQVGFPDAAPDGIGGPFGFDYEMTDYSSINGGYWLTDISKAAQNWYVDISNSKCNLDIMGEDWIYMEVDKYNTMDEIEPYSENTAGFYNNDYSGKVDSAFAKIPVQCTAFSHIYDSNQAFLSNISHYHPPIERISKLKFKFRYHDGRLVDFKWQPLSFVIEFNLLRDEIPKAMSLRVPPSYVYH